MTWAQDAVAAAGFMTAGLAWDEAGGPARDRSFLTKETAILKATKSLALNLSVEESGSREFLEQRLAQDGPFEALHLSCHGDIVDGKPVLALESPEGRLDLTSVASFCQSLGEEGQKPALVFLSACRTAEHGAAAASFAQLMVRSGVANALGWDGSVYDENAILFAQTFYKQLAAARSVSYAGAHVRAGGAGCNVGDKQAVGVADHLPCQLAPVENPELVRLDAVGEFKRHGGGPPLALSPLRQG